MPKKSTPKIDSAKVVNDVAKPGETPAMPTSRPIIVKHSDMIKKDPMVRGEADTQGEIKPHVTPVIEPLEKESEEVSTEKPKNETATESQIENEETETPLADEPVPEEPEVPVAEKAEAPEEPKEPEASQKPEEEPKPEEPDSKKGTVDALVSEATSKQEDRKQKEELEAKTREIEKAVESKEFFVPIGQVSRRKSNNRAILGLLLFIIACAVAVNFAADAEIFDLGFNPLTDLL